ncbi:MAG: ammonia channel protein, partial [Thermomonas sp.]|uniref:ammonium transporter n=1 Tax=Thermomonas sp. TaxID=1971895 RepID=UPI0039E5EF51
MKMRFIQGWKTRAHALALAALCGMAALSALPAFAQDAATPVAETTEAAAAPADAVTEPAAEPAAAAVEPAAAEAAPAAEAEAPAPTIDSGDTAWMLTSTLLVILMTIPGLALFYGGLARSKNVLSVLAQVLVIFSLISVLWAVYGYSLAFIGAGKFIGSLDKLFLKGVTPDSIGALATIPEYAFIAFQGTFAAITTALIVGSFAERIKFKSVLLFSVLWFTL